MQINPVTQTAAANSSASTPVKSGTDSLANKEVFLQMLVAQIQNQDPLNPTDTSQFTSQLAQFSSLEQLIGIKQDMDSLTSAATTNNTTTPGA